MQGTRKRHISPNSRLLASIVPAVDQHNLRKCMTTAFRQGLVWIGSIPHLHTHLQSPSVLTDESDDVYCDRAPEKPSFHAPDPGDRSDHFRVADLQFQVAVSQSQPRELVKMRRDQVTPSSESCHMIGGVSSL